MVEIPGFCSGAYELPSKNIDAQRCINLIPEKTESGNAKSPVVLVNSPGFEVLVDFSGFNDLGQTATMIRGMYVTSDDRLIVVANAKVYAFESFEDWENTTAFGSLSNSAERSYGPVTIIDNGNVLFIQSWGAIYTWNLSNLSVALSAPTWDTGAFSHVVFQGSFFVINSTDSEYQRQMFCSPIDWNGTGAWNTSVDTQTLSTVPAPINGIISVGKDTWVFSRDAYEIWYFTGAETGFPFEPNVSLSYRIGLAAPYSLATTQNQVFWLGSGSDGFGKVYTNSAYQAQRISTNGLESEIASYSTVTDAIGETYQDIGHVYYCLTFPSANKTWVYDLSTGQWHQRMSFNIGGFEERAWRVKGTLNFGNRVIGYDNSQVASIVEVKTDVYTEALPGNNDNENAQILRLRSCPHIFSGLNRLFYSRFQVDMQTGVGIESTDRGEGQYDLAQGYDPKMRMRYSSDGGYAWSNFLLAAIGKIGERFVRVFWTRLGSARDRVFEISTTEPVPIRIMGGWVQFKKGNS